MQNHTVAATINIDGIEVIGAVAPHQALSLSEQKWNAFVECRQKELRKNGIFLSLTFVYDGTNDIEEFPEVDLCGDFK